MVVAQDAEGVRALEAGRVGAARSHHRDEQGDDRANGDEPSQPSGPQAGQIRDEHGGHPNRLLRQRGRGLNRYATQNSTTALVR